MEKLKNIAVPVTLILIATVFTGLSLALHRNTMARWWQPAAICILPAAISGWLASGAFRKLTGIKPAAVNTAIAAALALSVLTGCFYAINFFGSDHSSRRAYETTVVSKHSETRYHTKRISRNRTTRGEPYNVYFISFRLPDGSMKELEIPVKKYLHVSNNGNLKIYLEDGMLGFPVIRDFDIPENRHRRNRHNITNHIK